MTPLSKSRFIQKAGGSFSPDPISSLVRQPRLSGRRVLPASNGTDGI